MDGYLLRTRLTTLPTADSFRRGQFILLENPGSADDILYLGIQEAAGTYDFKEIPFGPITVTVIVQEGDSTVDAAVTTLDFDASDFSVTSSPSGEANIALAYGTSAGTPAEGNHTHDTVPIGGSLTFHGFNGTGGSTSSTVTYADVVSKSFTLPTGTWEVEANGWGRIGHTSPGNLDLRMTVDGTTGTAATLSAPSTGAYPGAAYGSKSSVASGSRTVTLQIKANTAGTAIMTNASLIVTATRTA